jgi:hypothetical protein
MTVEIASLNDSWKDEVQKRILKAEAEQKVANDRFDDLYQKSLVSLTEVHNQIASLTTTGGKGKSTKWELSRPKDIEATTFDGKEDSWPRWKEEIEDYTEAVYEGYKNALDVARQCHEHVTHALLNQVIKRTSDVTA